MSNLPEFRYNASDKTATSVNTRSAENTNSPGIRTLPKVLDSAYQPTFNPYTTLGLPTLSATAPHTSNSKEVDGVQTVVTSGAQPQNTLFDPAYIVQPPNESNPPGQAPPAVEAFSRQSSSVDTTTTSSNFETVPTTVAAVSLPQSEYSSSLVPAKVTNGGIRSLPVPVNLSSAPISRTSYALPGNNELSSQSTRASSSTNNLPAVSQVQPQVQPLLVNSKQHRRILKRREQRRKFEDLLKKRNHRGIKERGYIWESRHQHARTRPRGPNGRFLSTAEIEAYKNGTLEIRDPVQRAIADKYINSETSSTSPPTSAEAEAAKTAE